MNTLKTLAVLSFIALLSFGVASCRHVTGPGTGTGDTNHHPVDTTHFHDTTTVGDTFHFRHHRDHDFDSLNHRDTIIYPPPPDTTRDSNDGGLDDTIIYPPPPDTTRDSNDGGLDSTLLDSLLHH